MTLLWLDCLVHSFGNYAMTLPIETGLNRRTFIHREEFFCVRQLLLDMRATSQQ